MGRVAVVTDSTADLPEELIRELEITVVPLRIIFGEEVYRDREEIALEDFYRRLLAGEIARTSQPPPADFASVYQALFLAGKSIVSIHISGGLSGTVRSAQAACQLVPEAKVTIIDSRLVARALGIGVETAARLAREGRPHEEVARLAKECLARTRAFFSVSSLDYLQRGGRIGKAQALLGTLLNIKPLLTFEEGIICPYEKVRGKKALLRRMAEAACMAAAGEPVLCQLLHAADPEPIPELRSLLEGTLPAGSRIIEGRVGAIVAAHAGPSVFGVVVTPLSLVRLGS
ncbi:degV family protein [Ammonifex degensii KC4]|uniref:DegV family protein n=1 Tax=Ammonifex degensii (strain DSM 10501 / KC4) TaxID=429009 RepID=C9R911_AMMDK|nr:DegV family protein [Ammonifex degensii]ACX52790.1 degV family protein [Ammonifex degensii KC4]